MSTKTNTPEAGTHTDGFDGFIAFNLEGDQIILRHLTGTILISRPAAFYFRLDLPSQSRLFGPQLCWSAATPVLD